MRIWSSWTAVDVWLTGIVSPLLISGELGLPGSSSMKKLPSRKIRGRISAKASLWIGLPAPLTVKRTTVASPSRSAVITLPTSTPAMRTGEFLEMFTPFEKVALSSYP